jgi:predicted MFS family arabinose efflux permease
MPERNRWLIVLASALALLAGQGAINVFAAGVFLKPVAQDLGFGRGEISTAIAASNIMIAIASPFFGRALDAYGVRRPLLASITFFALATASMALLTPSLIVLFSLYGIAGLVGVGQNPTAYSKVLASYFDRNRGLAMGLALAGVGLGTALMPTLSNLLISAFGWRIGYLGLGLLIVIFALGPVAFLLPEPRAKQTDSPAELPGMSFAQAIGTRTYWTLALTFFFAATTINGALVHVVPLLTDRGVPASTAVSTVAAAGLALIAGRVVAGYIIDLVFAPYVLLIFLVGPIVGIAILGWNLEVVSPLVGTILLGMGIGAEIDLMSFLITRYFGIRAFGALHGLMFSIFVLGNAAGAGALGWSFQLLKSYSPAFAVFEALLLAACVLVLSLGPYRYPVMATGN